MKKRKIYLIISLLIVSIVSYLIIPSRNCNQITTRNNTLEKKNIYKETTTGVLIINTGTPTTLSKEATKCFIEDMLSDPYVMGMPTWLRTTLARKIIAPLRASSSLEKYSLIWGDSEQSPLLLNTIELADSIEKQSGLPVAVAMRYGTPNIENAMNDLNERCPKMNRVILLPLFPQYAESSYQTAVDAVKQFSGFISGKYTLEIITPYYNNPGYIAALADKIRTELKGDKNCYLVFSYHSLPLTHIHAGKLKGKDFDYEYQCCETARLTAEELGINDYSVVYASAMGKKWLGPMLDESMIELPNKGIKKIAIVAPGFIIDNLETLYDININAKKIFLENGGESFVFIPCLNSMFTFSF